MLSPASQPEQLTHAISALSNPIIGSGLSSNNLFNPLDLSHQPSGQLDTLADRVLQQPFSYTGESGSDDLNSILPMGVSDRLPPTLSTPRSSTVDDLTGQSAESIQVGTNTVNSHDRIASRQTLNSANDLGVIRGMRRVNGSLQGNQLTHAYEITLNTTSNLRLNLKGLKANADLRLVQDVNQNGLVDRGEVLYLSNAAGRASELIRINGLEAGTYYVQVMQRGGNTNYLLSMQTRQTEPGIDLSSSTNLGVLQGRGSTTGSVTDLNTDDMYRFRLDSASDLNLRLSGLSRNADLYLVQDVNNNGRMDASDILARSLRIGPSPETIQVDDLAAGTYFALVGQQRGSTNYTLTWTVDSAGETMGSARDLGLLNGSTTVVDFVGEPDPADFYQFSLNDTTDVTVTLDNLTADADLYVVQDANGNGVVDEDDVLAASLNTGSSAESIVLEDVAAGDYFVYVNEYEASTNYQLTLDAQEGNGNSGVRTVAGDFRANTFTYLDGYQYTVISGNGNVDFGSGQRDVLDLSQFSSTAVEIDLADTQGGGVVFDPGNGARVFDAITLADGSQILFEGIDTVRFANTTLNLAVVPNDPLFNQQWNLHMMDVDGAWRFTTGASDVLIGVQDTGLGVDEDGAIHPDLRQTYIHYDNYEDETFDQLSHGTAVQSIIAATSNNGIGMSGINWNSDVFALDVISGGDFGDYGLGTAAQLMIAMAGDSNQKLVVNMSLSGGNDPLFEQLVAANQNDVLFVIASGNEDRNSISYPSMLANSYGNVMAVGASWGTSDYYGNPINPGTRISYSGWWGSNYGTGLSIMGPSEVVAADATANWFGTSFDFSSTFNGTSAATPNVAGVASLVWSVNPDLTAVQVQEILAATAIDLGDPGYDTEYGNGFVNAESAVRMALAMA